MNFIKRFFEYINFLFSKPITKEELEKQKSERIYRLTHKVGKIQTEEDIQKMREELKDFRL